MEREGISSALRQEILRLAEFLTCPAAGGLVGGFIVDYAMELLGVTKDQKLYGVCENPDASRMPCRSLPLLPSGITG